MKYLNNDVITHIFEYVYPTKFQMANWKIEHYLTYHMVLFDIENIIIEVKIENGKKKEYFSLSYYNLDNEWYSDDYWSYTDEEELEELEVLDM